MVEWQETVMRVYNLGHRLLDEPGSKKLMVRLAFGTHTLQVRWEKDNAMELRVSEPGVEETQLARLILRLADKQYVNGIVVTRLGQSEEALKSLINELLKKWKLAESKFSN